MLWRWLLYQRLDATQWRPVFWTFGERASAVVTSAFWVALIAGAAFLLWYGLRRARRGAREYLQVAWWGAALWLNLVVILVAQATPLGSRGHELARSLRLLLGICWIIWGIAGPLPVLLRERKQRA